MCLELACALHTIAFARIRGPNMVLRIEKVSHEQIVILRLSGRLQSEHLEELKANGRDPAYGGEAAAKRGGTNARRKAELRDWEDRVPGIEFLQRIQRAPLHRWILVGEPLDQIRDRLAQHARTGTRPPVGRSHVAW